MLTQRTKLFAALLVTLVFTAAFGCGMVQAAPAGGPVGVCNFTYLVNQHPDTPQANEELKAEQAAAKKEFDEKSVGMSDKDKLELQHQLSQRVEQKRLQLLKAVADKVVVIAKEVAAEKGLSIVIGNNDVVCGGVDITDNVLKKMTKK